MEYKMKGSDEWKTGKIMSAQPKSTGKYSHWLNIIFTHPSAQAGYETRSIFKRRLTGFEFRVFLLLD